MRKAIFIDNDGALIKDCNAAAHSALEIFEEHLIDGFTKLSGKDFLYLVLSGTYHLEPLTEQELAFAEAHITQLLLADEIMPETVKTLRPCKKVSCRKKFDATCHCRKPMPTLLLQAARDFNIDLEQSWMIGDILNDMETGNTVGCKSIIVDNGNETEWLVNKKERKPLFIAKTLTEAADFIIEHAFAATDYCSYPNNATC